MSRYTLTVYRCSQHGTMAVCLDTENGGTRLTSAKCCGRWDTLVKEFPMPANLLRDAATEFDHAATEEEAR